jgi:hypothetical protein
MAIPRCSSTIGIFVCVVSIPAIMCTLLREHCYPVTNYKQQFNLVAL